MTDQTPRLLDFDNIYNFRDFGNYSTEDGRRVSARKLFRSAHLASASASDLAQVKDFDIRIITDLRHRPERDRQPNLWPDGHAAQTITNKEAQVLGADDGREAMAPHEAFTKYTLQEAHQARDYMIKSYRTRPDDPGFRHSFGTTLKTMAATGDPLLIHCAAGKDRTGTLAAIILGALGVDGDTIMEDYMLTLRAIDIDAMLSPAAKAMSKRYERTLKPEILRPLFIVEPDYLQASLETIGNLDSYLSDALGISTAERDALRAHYTTD